MGSRMRKAREQARRLGQTLEGEEEARGMERTWVLGRVQEPGPRDTTLAQNEEEPGQFGRYRRIHVHTADRRGGGDGEMDGPLPGEEDTRLE